MNNLETYKKQYSQYKSNFIKAKNEFETFKATVSKDVNEIIKLQNETKLKWFIDHFSQIMKWKEHFINSSGFDTVIIDFLPLYYAAGFHGMINLQNGSTNQKYKLNDLFYLWDNGFTYKNYPIIKYGRYACNARKHVITYIKNNKAITETLIYQDYKEIFSEELLNKIISFNRKDINDLDNYRGIEGLINLWV